MTRQPHIFFIVLSAAFVPITADACARMQPVAAFVVLNDQDGDRALNLTEWLAASTGDNLIASFKLNDPEEFAHRPLLAHPIIQFYELERQQRCPALNPLNRQPENGKTAFSGCLLVYSMNAQTIRQPEN